MTVGSTVTTIRARGLTIARVRAAGTDVWLAAGAAPAFDAAGPGATSLASAASLSWSHTASGADRAVVVGLAVGLGASVSYTSWTRSVTYDGVAMTSLGVRNSNDQTSGFVELFGLLDPPTGAKTVVASATRSGFTPNSLIAESVSYTGVGSFGTATTAISDGVLAPSLVVSSAAGRMVAAAMASGGNISTPTQTQRYLNNLDGSTAAGKFIMQDAAGASSVTFSAADNNDWWGMVAVDLLPPAGRTGFVYRDAATLMLNGVAFRFVGSNNIDMLGKYTGTMQTQAQIDAYFALWPANTVHRIFGAQEWGGGSTTTAGFDQIKRVIDSAAAHNQKVAVSLADGATSGNKAPTYTRAWYQSGYTGTDPAHQYGPPGFGTATTNYFGWIDTLCAAFKDSPAIAWWDVMNEPGASGTLTGLTNAEMKSFLDTSAARIKAADPNHLVATGLRGPNTSFDANLSDDQNLHSGANIDLVVCHEYSYAYEGQINGSTLVNTSCQVAANLSKPLIVEESGVGNPSGSVTAATRVAVLAAKLDIFFGRVQDSANTPNAFTHPIKGYLYWDCALSVGVTGTVTNADSAHELQTGGTVIGELITYSGTL